MLRKVDSSSTFVLSYYHRGFNLSRNKFDFNACDWLSAKCGYAAKSCKLKKKMADAADGEDEFEAVDQRLSESQKFSLYKDLEGYRSLWFIFFQ